MSLKSIKELVQAKSIKVTFKLNGKNLQKVRWLDKEDREFFHVTPQMMKKVMVGVDKALGALLKAPKGGDGGKAAEDVLEGLGEVIRSFVANRLKNHPEYGMTELAESTVKAKGNERIGYDSGDLWRNVKSCDIIVSLGVKKRQ